MDLRVRFLEHAFPQLIKLDCFEEVIGVVTKKLLVWVRLDGENGHIIEHCMANHISSADRPQDIWVCFLAHD